jgi:ABC-2 type transport system ATP-binding protein
LIAAHDLTKRYGGVLALDRLAMEIPQGAVFGLLGPNGSGKSTLVRLLMGFIGPDAGRLDRGGLDPWRIGYLPERPYFPPGSPVGEYLRTLGSLSGLHGHLLSRAVDFRLEQVDLVQTAGWRIGAYSKGMLQRLALAAALLNDPPVLVLDEPMEGLDPLWQKALRDIIRSLHAQGRTILLSTHRLGDIAALCTHVGILNRGRLVKGGIVEQVVPFRREVRIDVDGLTGDTVATLVALEPGVSVSGDVVTLSGEGTSHKNRVLRLLLDSGADIAGVSRPRASLEDVYLEALAL